MSCATRSPLVARLKTFVSPSLGHRRHYHSVCLSAHRPCPWGRLAAKVDRWTAEISQFPGRILLVGTKLDLASSAREVLTAEGAAVAEKHGWDFREVRSCKPLPRCLHQLVYRRSVSYCVGKESMQQPIGNYRRRYRHLRRKASKSCSAGSCGQHWSRKMPPARLAWVFFFRCAMPSSEKVYITIG